MCFKWLTDLENVLLLIIERGKEQMIKQILKLTIGYYTGYLLGWVALMVMFGVIGSW